jgi:hypothetical protein
VKTIHFLSNFRINAFGVFKTVVEKIPFTNSLKIFKFALKHKTYARVKKKTKIVFKNFFLKRKGFYVVANKVSNNSLN